jgi:hypothetical protein
MPAQTITTRAAASAAAVCDQPVNPRYPDIVNRVDLVAHHLGRDLRFLGHGNVAGPRAHHRDLAFAVNVRLRQNRIAPDIGKYSP